MKRSTRAELARGTVEIVERGSYRSASGRIVDIARPIRACLEATRYYPPEELERLRGDVLGHQGTDDSTVFEVVNETTLSGIARVLSLGQGPVAALNFASAKNPGGGFLTGARAQEEALARASGLYAMLLGDPMYTTWVIYSPDVPVFRLDEGRLLDEPYFCSFLTSPAVNALPSAVTTAMPNRFGSTLASAGM